MRFRHLYIDSRYRTVGTDSDFSINLNDTIELEVGARCWVAGVTFPNVFYTIEENVNDTFYAAIANGATTGGDADFSINLNETVETEEGTRCWVAGATFANVLYTIEEAVNDQ